MLTIVVGMFTGFAFMIWHAKDQHLKTHILSAWMTCTCVAMLVFVLNCGLGAIAIVIFTLDTLMLPLKKKEY
jgi:uncharacterized membrane protein